MRGGSFTHMSSAVRHTPPGTILLASSGYVIAGTATAFLAQAAPSAAAVQGWRLTAWLLSLAVFGLHFAIERRGQVPRRSVAGHVALAVAIGALAVAALGPIRTHWGQPHQMRLAALSLLAWPVLTGLPAFAVAWLAGFALDLAASRTRKSPSGVPDKR